MMGHIAHVTLMTGFQENDQKYKFSYYTPLIPRLRFFLISAMPLYLLYRPLTSYKISEKNNEQSLRYLKTDQWTDELTDG